MANRLNNLDQVNSNERGKILGKLAGAAAGLSPIRSFTFVLALVICALAAWVWIKQSGDPRPAFPIYGVVAASYAGGFLIGRVFRRVVKTAAIVAAIVLGGLALLSYAKVDTTNAKQAVKAGSTWVNEQAGRAQDYLTHLLPSGGAAGAGVFAGAGRKRKGDDHKRG